MSRSRKKTPVCKHQRILRAEKRWANRRMKRWQGTSSQKGHFRKYFGSYLIDDKTNNESIYRPFSWQRAKEWQWTRSGWEKYCIRK